jgi:hypothetical protein
MIGEYNTQRPHIILKEYGRNVQKLVEYIRNIPDKEKRTELAYTLLELMKQLTPSVKEATPENPQRMWDDLYIIADFNIDLNNPFPVPQRDILFKKPKRMDYPQSPIRFKHYGKNIERLVREAIKLKTPEEKQEAIIYLGKLMKTFYSAWNKETLDDSVILNDIREMSKGELTMNIDKVREDNLFEQLYREKRKGNPQQQERDRMNGGSGGHHKRNFKKNKNRRRDR